MCMYSVTDGKHGLRPCERALGIDEPALLSERGEERRKCLGVCQMCMDTEGIGAAPREPR